ncbi:unnamed protein product [Oncorhynchus mykiss]|uniref:BTB domain-containing protein n=1 Tax=Oncorhynchus mykiss TaxID=8022 RepID=A0A060WCH0_ONCMY|nr:unnamed protein product [Oncorhynchus mykiss]
MWGITRTRYADCNGSEASEETGIVLNIGGVIQVLCGDVLNRFPETRLAELWNTSKGCLEDLSSLCDDYDSGKGEFYFDRDPDAFKCIIELYYYGEIHIKRGICPICFVQEMEFWKIDLYFLDDCCKGDLQEAEDELAEIAEKVQSILVDREGDPSARGWQCFQMCLWKLLEKPESSLSARVIAIVSFLFILISSVVMCVGTIPDLQVEDAEGNHMEHPILEAIETTCIGWFTVEYVLRLISSPNKVKFVLSFMNIIDFMAIMPFYVVLTLTSLGTAMMELANLGMLLMYMGVGVFLFSALAYTLEQSHPETMFTSIPQSFWWAVITMTTVGYGDIYPKTTLGRCNAAVSFLCGVIAIALPIHPIINNFVIFYNKQQVLETAAKHEIELMALRSSEACAEESGPHIQRRSVGVAAGVWDNAIRSCHSDTCIPLLKDPRAGVQTPSLDRSFDKHSPRGHTETPPQLPTVLLCNINIK